MSSFPAPPRTVALCSAANFINAADRVIMPIAIIQMTDVFHWDLHSQGWLLSSFAVGYMSSQVVGGSVAKRYGGKLVLALSVFLWSMSTFLTPLLARWYHALVFSRILLGVGEGLGLPTIFHIFAHAVPSEERSTAFGYLVALGSIGQTMAAILCPHLHWAVAFYAFGFLGFLWCFVWLLLYREVRSGPTDEENFIQPPKVGACLDSRHAINFCTLI